jgi:methanogenic corrinoid protein MtbC1
MIPTLEQVGVDFQNGDIFVPELLMTVKRLKKSPSIWKPPLKRPAKPVLRLARW